MMYLLQRHKYWVIGLALVALTLATCAGIAVWTDRPVDYYGQWMWQHDVFDQVITPVTCVAHYPASDWYRLMAQIFPAPSMFKCFDTDTEARIWISQHLP